MNNTSRILITALLCTTAMACAKKVKPVAPPPVETAPTQPVTDNTPVVPGAYTPADLDTDACLRTRVLYFDLDQYVVRSEFTGAVTCHAKYLRDRPSSRMSIEGHTDERGSREYNLGLGERRANAVSSALQANGASGTQITVTSFGEERPVCTESNEDCWARNRRAEIVYTAK